MMRQRNYTKDLIYKGANKTKLLCTSWSKFVIIETAIYYMVIAVSIMKKKGSDKMAVSIYDVAKRAGVSISTVSRILNNSASVSEKKVRAVQEAMQYLDYAPNQFAQGLVKQKTSLIGVYLRAGSSTIFDSTFSLQILAGIEKVLSENQYSMVLLNESSDFEEQERKTPKYMEYLRKKKIDGLILNGVNDREAYEEIVEKGYPFVYIGKRYHNQGLSVYAQFEQYNYEKIHQLYNEGHRKIVFTIYKIHLNYLDEIMMRVQKEMPDAMVFPIIIPSFEKMKETFRNALQKYVIQEKFTAMCVSSMEDTRMILYLCAELNISIPDQLSFISVEHKKDDGESICPQISAFYVPAREMGIAVTKLLLDKIQGKKIKESTIEFESIYKKRETIKTL